MGVKKPHVYQVGEIVNKDLKIIEQIIITRHSSTRTTNSKGYIVQSLNYLEAPYYEQFEYDLKKGAGDTYISTSNRRIFEGNSLYSCESIRPYLTDIEQAKTIAPNHNKKIVLKCPYCDELKMLSPNTFQRQGFSCKLCSSNITYPELFMMSYLEVKGIEYESQKIFDDLELARFDFYIESLGVIETHGIQHYNKKSNWYKKAKESDERKRKYCKDNNISLIELDCRYSDFKFIREQIETNTFLENVKDDEVDKMLEIIERNKRYPVKEILEHYKNGLTGAEIGRMYGLTTEVICDLLRKCNVKSRGSTKRVECITTGKIFNSMKEAAAYYNLPNNSSIGTVCNGKRNFTGKYKGEKLRWRWVDY